MRRRLSTLTLSLLVTALILAPAARAEFGLDEFDVAFTGPPPPGSVTGTLGAPVTQAGAHPFQMVSSLHFLSHPNGSGGVTLDEAAKDILLDQVEGFVGAPTAVPKCSTAEFLTEVKVIGAPVPSCPPDSALGVAAVQLASKIGVAAPAYGAVYNLQSPPGVASRLGFWILGVPVTVELGVASSFPFKISGGPTNISQALEVVGSKFILWGNPADPAHDPIRGRCVSPVDGESLGECEAGITPTPFLTLPRACHGPLASTYRLDSWLHPGVFVEGSALTHDEVGNPQGMSGCGKLDFGPEVAISPTTTAAESASGLDVGIEIEDEGIKNPAGVAAADIESLKLAFPAGMTLNPSAAEGLGVCTKAQFQSAGLTVKGCPDAAKLGTIETDTPILENHTLKGSIYLAQQDDPTSAEPGAENPFDSFAAAYVIIRDPELGIFIPLATEIQTDEKTGQIIAITKELPPFPLSRVQIHLHAGPRAPFITPPSCATHTTVATLTPSSARPPLEVGSSFTLSSGPGGGPCPLGALSPFAPGFEAGTQSNAAGRYSPFSMRITRADGEQDLTRFSATLPPGVVGKIAAIASCSDQAIAAAKAKSGRAELAAPSCPASSKLGRVVAGAGVGSALTYVAGSLYLAGPYNGSPLSVVAIVPAVAGPFDVGTVVTRVALRLNPETYLAEVDGSASDPIPHILKGIPLKLRDLRVYTDRPQFTINATGCNEEHTSASLLGSGADPFNPADDVAFAASSRYQAASCASLGFKPTLALKLKGGMRRGDHPTLTSVLTPRAGDANIAKAAVILPHSEFIDPERINNPCTRVQFNSNSCPPGSVLGRARAYTPLLDQPLEGPVYFRSNGGVRNVPDIVADLNGQFHVVLIGAVDSVNPKNARIRTTFFAAPDAPVSKFELTLKGGKKGVLVNSANLCAKKRHVKLKLSGQNGKVYETSPVLGSSCAKK